jgi:hypothetical protein
MHQDNSNGHLTLDANSASRRLRGLSREIGLALALTAAAAASVVNPASRPPSETASIDVINVRSTNPAAKSQ